MLRAPSSHRHIALVFALLAASDGIPAASIPRQDRAWKMYLNRTTGFCVSYPSRWMKSETYDGSGFAVTAGIKRHSPIPVGSMDVSALALPAAQIRSATLTLDDDFD